MRHCLKDIDGIEDALKKGCSGGAIQGGGLAQTCLLVAGLLDGHRWPVFSKHATAKLILLFAGINYFDGQRFMAHKNLNLASVLELSGTSICVKQFTTTELNLADFFSREQHDI